MQPPAQAARGRAHPLEAGVDQRLTPFFYYVLYVSGAITTLFLLVVTINYFDRSTDRAETELVSRSLRQTEGVNSHIEPAEP